MKKLLAVLLICVLMFTLAVPALGESGYEILKDFLSGTGDEPCYLGLPTVEPYANAEKIIMLGYVQSDSTMVIAGINAAGQGELCGWNNVDVISAFSVFLNVCTAWDAFAAMCDRGYSLMLAWDYGEDYLFIDSSEEAALFVETLQNMGN